MVASPTVATPTESFYRIYTDVHMKQVCSFMGLFSFECIELNWHFAATFFTTDSETDSTVLGQAVPVAL